MCRALSLSFFLINAMLSRLYLPFSKHIQHFWIEMA